MPYPASQSPTATLIREIDTLECSTTRGLDAAQAECQTIHQKYMTIPSPIHSRASGGSLGHMGGRSGGISSSDSDSRKFPGSGSRLCFSIGILERGCEKFTRLPTLSLKRGNVKRARNKERKGENVQANEETKKRQKPMRKATMTPQALLALSLFGKH